MSMQLSPSGGPQFDLADHLRKALRESGVTVQEMADYLDVNRNTIGRWINGHNAPSGAAVRLWALRTGVPYSWLVGRESPRQDGPSGGGVLPRLDSNQQPFGYAGSQVTALRAVA
jgi:transcriptional regulator with XRE-family HTH domain